VISNYSYTVLEGEVRIKAIAEGYDPAIGIMHEGRDGSSKVLFDRYSRKINRPDSVCVRQVSRSGATASCG
jgi:hypothetical protein